MGLFSKRDKNAYGDYADAFFDENYTLSDEGILPIGMRQDINHAPHALTAEEVKGEETDEPIADIPMQSAGESLYKRMMDARKADAGETDKKSKEIKQQAETLLSRCSQFVTDDKTSDSAILSSQPAYTLDSVDDIIAEAEKRAQERIRNIYGTASARDAAQAPKAEKLTPAPVPVLKKVEEKPKENEKSAAVGITLPKAAEKTNQPLPEEKIPTDDKTVTDSGIRLPEKKEVETEEIPMKRESDVKNYQYRFADEELNETPTAEEKTMLFDTVREETPSFAEEIRSSLNISNVVEDDKTDNLPDAEEEIYGDYETVADAHEIRTSLKRKLSSLNIRFMFTFIAAAILAVLQLPFLSDIKETNAVAFLIAETVITAAAALLNLDVFGSLAAIFKKKPCTDFPLAICTVAVLAENIYSVVAQNLGGTHYGFIVSVMFLFSLIGKKSYIKRILKNFEKIANAEEKTALCLIDENNGSARIARDSVEGEALVASGRKTVNITSFLKNSYSRDPFSEKSPVFSLVSVGAAAVASAYCFMTLPLSTALSLTAAFFCVAAPLSSALVGTLPLKSAAKRLAKYGAVLTGFSAADAIEPVNAVTFDIADIFPRGTVKMYDMKILSPNNLEKTIFNAAAVATSANSPLGHVFRRIARTSEQYVLPNADSVKYEKRMGISGWVGDDSLLIGNRTLMETHGVSVPSVEVDKKILRNGYFPVYVASNGTPCALLIIGYENRADITTELIRLCKTGVTLLINNCDPNVTEDMLYDYFGLPNDFVKLMSEDSIKKCKEETEFCESLPAKAAYDGSACGIASIVTAAIKVKRLTAAMTVLHVITLIIGLAGTAAAVFTGNAALITPLSVTAYLLSGLVLVLFAPLFCKP